MTVLIVDDITRVVESVRDGVRWDALGVEIVLCACSVREAKNILGSQPVDVLLCDIEMPFQNGFDLLTWCREQSLDIECIFLTAHADFEYARTALSLGGFDYILQPASLDEIEEAVKRACDRLSLKRSRVKKAQRGSFWDSQKGLIMSSLLLHALSPEWDRQTFLHGIEGLDMKRWEKRNWLCGFLRRRQNDPPRLEEIKKCLAEEFALEEELIFLTLFQRSYVACLLPCREDGGELSVWTERLGLLAVPEKGIKTAGLIPAIEALRQWSEKLSEDSQDIVNLSEVIQEEPPVRKAMEFIRDNLDSDLSRQQVADVVFLHPDHLSRLFKRETGHTLSEYIMCEKMGYAAKLLMQTSIPVSLVAYKVGFHNYSHFSQVFRKMYGLSPREYRLMKS